MFHRGVNYPTQRAKCSTEVLNVLRRVSNIPRRGESLHGGVKCSTEGVKCSTEASNIPRRC